MVKLYNLKPPKSVKGMVLLDKTKFDKNLLVGCLELSLNVKVSSILPKLKKYLLKLSNFKPVCNKDEIVNIYLNPDLVKTWNDLNEEDRNHLQSMNILESSFKYKSLTIGYENFTADDVLKSVLLDEKEGMASYTKIGHIVHVNLREHLVPYKNLIGDVLYDKVHGCRTVVNKLNVIDNTYRNFKMEVLAGENDMMAKLKENGCLFEFDFSTVYWNSRLSTEHERIVQKLKTNDVLFDVFAGVGPFSIPISKKKCFVYANDLNPESFKWLNHNARINRIDRKYLKTFNKDGSQFILTDLKENLIKFINKENIYITMNLPASAVEFLSAFYKLFTKKEVAEITKAPILFVYCFAKGENCEAIAKDLIMKNFGWDMSDKIKEIFRVRTVSSMKEMMRVTIELDKDILYGREAKRKIQTYEDCEIHKKC